MSSFANDTNPLSDGNLEQCVNFLHALHPQLDTACAVCREVYTRGLAPRNASRRSLDRTGALGAFQKACLKVSLTWEQDQESGAYHLAPVYRPDAKVMQVRFIADFARRHLFKSRSHHLAVAVGSCLYTYDSIDAYRMACLQDDKDQNRRRKIRDVRQGIQRRFPPSAIEITMQPPQSRFQRQLLCDMLRTFTPWEEDCLPEHAVLDVERSAPPDWDRKHAILCAGKGCAGWEQLARQYIQDTEEAKQRAEAEGEGFPWAVPPLPEHSLEIPMFSPARFQPYDPDREQFPDNHPGLTDEQLRELRATIEMARQRDQHTRATNAFRRLSVAVDGHAQTHFAPEEGTSLPFRVSAYAVSLTLDGDDGSGPVPLAHFDVPEPETDEAPTTVMTVIPASGATITLTFAPLYEEEAITAWETTVRWTPEAAVQKDLAWYDALLGSILNECDLLQMLGSAALRPALGDVILPRLEEIEQGLRTWPGNEGRRALLFAHLGEALQRCQQAARAQTCWEAGLALAQAAADTALAAQLYARLRTLSQPDLTSQAQAVPEDAGSPAAMWDLAADLGDRVVRWFESVWHPTFAGEPVTAAADTPAQEEVFYVESGAIHVTCAWDRANLRLTWQTHPPLPGDLWARVVQRDNHSVVLAELFLGQAWEGDEVFTASLLGFDPTLVPWSLTLGLQEPPR